MKRFIYLIFCLFLWGNIADSTTVQFFTDQELTKRADMIFTGKCTGKQSYWNDEHNRIYTLYKFQVQTKIKGKKQTQTVSFKQWGGQVGVYRYAIAGLATFKPNEDAFTFLTPKNKGGFRYTVGLAQGKLRILRDKKGKRFLLRNTRDLHFKNSNKKGHLQRISDYEGFERKIRGFVQEEQNK